MAEVYCTSLCLQIKLFGGATLVNWLLMSLLGFAVDSLFRPIGPLFPWYFFFFFTEQINKRECHVCSKRRD